MATKKKVWERPRPAGKPETKTKLPPEVVELARALAAAAGRPYPNLVDNLAAMRRMKK